jgi:hypothetical protein
MKKAFQQLAATNGVTASYSGSDKKMFISGEDAAVKKFIRLQCLKGKEAFPFSIGQA